MPFIYLSPEVGCLLFWKADGVAPNWSRFSIAGFVVHFEHLFSNWNVYDDAIICDLFLRACVLGTCSKSQLHQTCMDWYESVYLPLNLALYGANSDRVSLVYLKRWNRKVVNFNNDFTVFTHEISSPMHLLQQNIWFFKDDSKYSHAKQNAPKSPWLLIKLKFWSQRKILNETTHELRAGDLEIMSGSNIDHFL